MSDELLSAKDQPHDINDNQDLLNDDWSRLYDIVTPMIKAVVFDCFGVLATETLAPFREKYFGTKPQLLAQLPELIARSTSGASSYSEFITRLSKLAGITEQDAREQIEGNLPNVELFDLIATRLKPSYKIGLLSNISRNRMPEIFTSEQLDLFDAIGLSYEIGANKPDTITYITIADRLGVEVSECVFVDDQQKYCEGAAEAGMKSILYKDFDSFKVKLEEAINRTK